MTDDNNTPTAEARAADSGSTATENFRARAASSAAQTSKERVSTLAMSVINAITDTVKKERVSYDEYNALKSWLISVGEDGEWPLFLDVWVEHAVEDVATDHREGSKGSIEGPYYVADAPEEPWNGTIEKRDDEPGEPFLFRGKVTGVDGKPLAGAHVELWHADQAGFYSQFAPGIPEWNLRGTFVANDEGDFAINTIQPAPYQIPTDGACGKLIAAAGWHAWRPAHLHVRVSHDGHESLTTQLYFPGDPHNNDDIASAVKPELLLELEPGGTTYNFVLDAVKA